MFNSDDYAVYPRGLKNLGNTCYLNSILQALSSCPSFIHYIKVINDSSDQLDNDNKTKSSSLFTTQLLHCIKGAFHCF